MNVALYLYFIRTGSHGMLHKTWKLQTWVICLHGVLEIPYSKFSLEGFFPLSFLSVNRWIETWIFSYNVKLCLFNICETCCLGNLSDNFGVKPVIWQQNKTGPLSFCSSHPQPTYYELNNNCPGSNKKKYF